MNKLRVVKLSLLVLLAFALSLPGLVQPSTASAQATVVKTNEEIPFDFILAFPSACPGEPVHITGTFHRVTTVTRDNRDGFFQLGGWHYRSKDNFSLVGEGLVTGTTYHMVGAGHQVMQRLSTNDNPGADVESVDDTLVLVSQGSDDNLVIHITVHTTINANGEVTSTVDNERLDCRG